MAHWKLTLSYDGTSFHGWQIQPGLVTVQGALAGALHRIAGENVLPQGSGRTDAGVHALAQIASFYLDAVLPPANLQRALNSVLPSSIRVVAAEIVSVDFHARHSATSKTYEYRIFERRRSSAGSEHIERVCPPFVAPYAWACRWSLDVEQMKEAASMLLGEHDFTSFAASDPDRSARKAALLERTAVHAAACSANAAPVACATTPNQQRTIFTSEFNHQPDLLLYRISGSGFLHHMVRNIVGTLADVGRGSLTPEQFQQILAAKDRTAAGPTAPAQGLFLVSVDYAEKDA